MRSLLPLLPKPSRYTGIEEGAVHKSLADIDLHCALAFPDTYEVGMSYLGQKILYDILNSFPTWWAERVMAPCREAGAVLREHKQALCSLESGTPLAQMHFVGFSITHELCFTNILYMLDLAGIPLRTSQRIADADNLLTWPIIMAGGGATLSAEPMAPFMDLMVVGEGEESLPEVARLLISARAAGWSRTKFLQEARHIAGVYVPSLFSEGPNGSLVPQFDDYPKATRRVVANLDAADYPVNQVVPIGAVHNRLSLEIARGCTRGCRFCHAGMVYRPLRERSLGNLHGLLEECLSHTGFDEVSFLSLSTGDFSALKTLFTETMDRCSREQVSVSLPSLRVGSIDDSIMERMSTIRRTGATLAPEAGSQRLRDVINKGITEEELILHVQKLLQHGWQQVKLYFMIGLPTETQADLDAIIDLCVKVRDAAGRGGPRLQVTAAISPFVPKPYTPFQWEEQISFDEITRRIHYLRTAFKGVKCMKMRWHEPAMSHLEGILSRADRRMAPVVESAFRKNAIFCSWMEGFSLEPWLEALQEQGLTAAEYTGARTVGSPLPWDHLDAGIAPLFLQRERSRALREKITQDCRYHACRQCGACDTKGRPSRLPRGKHEDTFGPRLNFLQRDQEAHQPKRDEQGRIVCPVKSAAPPRIAPELGIKAVQFRVWHTKEGGSAFLSQLELQAVLERALRRAALPMSFSQGFHPLPLLSFGRALPVGLVSLAEWFAITLREPLAAEEVQERLAPHLPKGMRLLRVTFVNTAKRTEQATREHFSVRHIGTPEAQAHFATQWAAFSQLDTWVWTRETKKGERSTDVRALLTSIAVQPDNSVDIIADWTAGYLSPQAIVLAVTGQAELPNLSITKTAQDFTE